MNRWHSLMAWVVMALCSLPSHALAATKGTGHNITVTAYPVRYPDVAYDAQNNVFLALTGNSVVQAQFVSSTGAMLPGPFGGGRFNLTTSTAYQHATRAECAAGVCLVVWHEGSPVTPMARVVSYTAGFVSQPVAIGPQKSAWEFGAGIAYSTAAGEFLVTWMGDYPAANNIYFARVNPAGQVLQTTALTTSTAYERQPSVAYNPSSQEFVIAYGGTRFVNGVETGYIRSQRVKDGATIGGPSELYLGGATYIPIAEYNPANQSVLISFVRGGRTYGRAVNVDGSLGALATLSTTYGSYDGLDVAFNPTASRFLVISHGSTAENVAYEVSAGLTPSSAYTATDSGGTGNYNPRIISSTAEAKWLVATSRSFKSLWVQFQQGTASAPPCSVSVTGSGASFTAAGGAGSVTVTVATPPCNWSASSNAAWIQVSPSDGTSSGTVNYTVQPNPSSTSGRSGVVTVAGQNFTITQTARSSVLTDFDGDGQADPVFYRSSNGTWYARLSSTGATESLGWSGLPGDIPLLGDFDGDTVPDPTLFRPGDGCWYILSSSTQAPSYICWGGMLEDIPVPADYDGDGKTDAAFYRPSERYWYILKSSTNSPMYVFWGGSSADIPAPADFDGDKKADVAFYRPTDKYWYIIRSSNWTAQYTLWGTGAGDVPVPADYDGDGKADVAYFRPAQGYWYIKQSVNNASRIVYWGNSLTNKPVPADYDGDRKADVAFFEAPYFYIIKSTTGLATYYTFGSAGDVAVTK